MSTTRPLNQEQLKTICKYTVIGASVGKLIAWDLQRAYENNDLCMGGLYTNACIKLLESMQERLMGPIETSHCFPIPAYHVVLQPLCMPVSLYYMTLDKIIGKKPEAAIIIGALFGAAYGYNKTVNAEEKLQNIAIEKFKSLNSGMKLKAAIYASRMFSKKNIEQNPVHESLTQAQEVETPSLK